MKILFATDLHGNIEKYDRLFSIVREKNIQLIINGGDMLPKTRNLMEQSEFLTGYLKTHLAEYDRAGVYYLGFMGNDDLKIYDSLYEEICETFFHIENIAQKKFSFGGYEFIGMNWVVDYPFRLKDRCRMDSSEYIFQKQLGTGLLSTPEGLQEIEDWMSYAEGLPTIQEELELLPIPENIKKTIYVIHTPPYGVGLDTCFSGENVGSRALLNFLLKHQPLLSLHGHIHESPEMSGNYYARIGNTLSVQPGQSKPLTYVILDLETMELDRYKE